MKTKSCIGLMALMLAMPSISYADYSDKKFQAEVREGLDLIGARANANVVPDAAPGALGADVYLVAGAMPKNSDIKLFIPSTMYLRMGGGFNLGFATDYARIGNDSRYKSSGSYTTQIGLGWNLSSYVRGELDFQNMNFAFHDLDNAAATYHTLGGMLYFDLARRYVMQGDITRRRTFVPFMGVGAGVGAYEFQGTAGADGFVLAAPRAALGFNVMLNDLIGIDVMYQYQMMIGNGFGWDVRAGGVDNISNIMAAFRVNF